MRIREQTVSYTRDWRRLSLARYSRSRGSERARGDDGKWHAFYRALPIHGGKSLTTLKFVRADRQGSTQSSEKHLFLCMNTCLLTTVFVAVSSSSHQFRQGRSFLLEIRRRYADMPTLPSPPGIAILPEVPRTDKEVVNARRTAPSQCQWTHLAP